MKRCIAASVVALCFLAGCEMAGRAPEETAVQAGVGRSEILLSGPGWKFLKADPLAAETIADDSKWQSVSIPHTWNNLDGEDGGFDKKGNYLRAACWYRRHLTVSPEMAGRVLVLKFEGANRRADVFVNGALAGTHVGGFGAFTFDITKLAKAGDNVIAVRVTNEFDVDSPPLSADFTFFGGLYRPVELLVLDPVHISTQDHASPGVTIRTSDVSDGAATISVRTLVHNTAGDAADVHVVTHITDAAGGEVASLDSEAHVDATKSAPVQSTIKMANPHLWNGRKDPYLYTVTVDVVRDGKVLDEVQQPLGLRYFSIDKEKGFILNGQPYGLHGVDRHQDRPEKGWAISNADHEEDMALIKEMGCTAIRLAHYQHSEYFYELCDREGIVVWAEVPVVNEISQSKAFADNAEQQLTELIRQNMNHPSICFWSIANEVSGIYGDPAPLFKAMNALAHKEDSSRITTMAFTTPKKDGVKTFPRDWPGITDTFGQNRYFGWYRGEFADFAKFLETCGSCAISEYGAGSSIYFHSEHPSRMDHTEEYQCIFHEYYWPAIKAKPNVWGSFVWNMFDFAADQRKEGDHAGRNDKGLVTYDRKTRKDAFYYYKANWTDEPMVHINSQRFTVRGQQEIAVKVYSNVPKVELIVNGQSVGKQSGSNCVFVWEKVGLQEGENHVVARGVKDGKEVSDECVWTYKPGAPTAVYVGQDDVMRRELEKGPPVPTPDPAILPAATQPAE